MTIEDFTDHGAGAGCTCVERGPAATGDRAALDAGDGVEGTKPPEGQC
ncbi:hypothetical protein [Gordonia oryzae]|nr:hypothetical protein [Gordonia oryzae]